MADEITPPDATDMPSCSSEPDHDWRLVDATPSTHSDGVRATLVCVNCWRATTVDGPVVRDEQTTSARSQATDDATVAADGPAPVAETAQSGAGTEANSEPDGQSDATANADELGDETADSDPDPETDVDERVSAFPARSEIVVDHPTDDTRERLARVGHVANSDADGTASVWRIEAEDVWSAAVDDADELVATVRSVAGDGITSSWETQLRTWWDDAHRYRLETDADGHTQIVADSDSNYQDLKRRLDHNDHYTRADADDRTLRVTQGSTADVKERLYEAGHPVVDARRLESGASLKLSLADGLQLRDYQQDWVDHFAERKAGVFVGPPGSGKTVAALGAMEAVGGETLILVPGRELVSQWEDELLSKTTLEREQIGQYHGGEKRIRPVTIATYDIAAMSEHRELFNDREWGLVVCDEAQHTPAKTWRRFRDIQSVARLGLSATPVREAGNAKEIYTLIGPPVGSDWGRLFREDWVSKPTVEVVEVPWASDAARKRYERADGAKKLIEAARNPAKETVIEELLRDHAGEKTLIYADWIRQGRELSERLGLPFVYGETGHDDRETYYQKFRDGEVEALILSRVADEGIDLPDAEVVILASTMGSSRSQTGQRVGRVMRPGDDAHGYIVLTGPSDESEWGRQSTQYLVEKGVDVGRSKWSGGDQND